MVARSVAGNLPFAAFFFFLFALTEWRQQHGSSHKESRLNVVGVTKDTTSNGNLLEHRVGRVKQENSHRERVRDYQKIIKR